MPDEDQTLPRGYQQRDPVDLGPFRERLRNRYEGMEVVVTDAIPNAGVAARTEGVVAERGAGLELILVLLLCGAMTLFGASLGVLGAVLHRRPR